MIDTNIFDKLITDSYFPDIWNAINAQLIKFLTTPIQEKEISNITNARKKQLISIIKRTVIPLVQASEAVQYPQLTPDIQIAYTAADSADIFVTEDKPLRQWYQNHYPNHIIYDYQQFLIWFLQNIYPYLNY
ncbi:MAG: hypothetical protein GX994_01015 [Firmicutes bacterium]|nr:hypothetical protein [Bacillota bacterium]